MGFGTLTFKAQFFSVAKFSSFVCLPTRTTPVQRRRALQLTITTCQSIEPIYTLAELQNKKQQTLLDYVNSACDDFLSDSGNWINLVQFNEDKCNQIPQPVIDAMNEIVTKQVGSLPHPFYKVSIATSGQVCKQQLEQQLKTGIMLKNLEIQAQIQDVFQNTDTVPGQDLDCLHTDYAPGSQTTHVDGYVFKWNQVKEELIIIDAKEYIRSLEQKVEQLQQKVQAQEQDMQNDQSIKDGLLDVLRKMEKDERMKLTDKMSPEVQEAMTRFVSRLVQSSIGLLDEGFNFDAQKFAKILFLAMVVGYGLRDYEHYHDLEWSMLGSQDQNVLKSLDSYSDELLF